MEVLYIFGSFRGSLHWHFYGTLTRKLSLLTATLDSTLHASLSFCGRSVSY